MLYISFFCSTSPRGVFLDGSWKDRTLSQNFFQSLQKSPSDPIRQQKFSLLIFSSDEFCWRTNTKMGKWPIVWSFSRNFRKNSVLFIFDTFYLQYDSENESIKRKINGKCSINNLILFVCIFSFILFIFETIYFDKKNFEKVNGIVVLNNIFKTSKSQKDIISNIHNWI